MGAGEDRYNNFEESCLWCLHETQEKECWSWTTKLHRGHISNIQTLLSSYSAQHLVLSTILFTVFLRYICLPVNYIYLKCTGWLIVLTCACTCKITSTIKIMNIPIVPPISLLVTFNISSQLKPKERTWVYWWWALLRLENSQDQWPWILCTGASRAPAVNYSWKPALVVLCLGTFPSTILFGWPEADLTPFGPQFFHQ